MNNLLELKTLSADLLMRYYLHGDRNARKAYQASKMLVKELPSLQNIETMEMLEEIKNLDQASEYAHRLMLYYEENNNSEGVVGVFKSMPKNMQELPFAWHMYNKHKVPKTWGAREICYYATFGKEHFEKWGVTSLKTGLGGSETAVIKLCEEWAKKGWKPTVYCDCGMDEGEHNGVKYVAYYKFNHRDNFNVFINWRSSHLGGKIKAKKFIVDLHDLFNAYEHKDFHKYDKLFVKSNYHKSLAGEIPEERIKVISNGI